MRNEHIRINTTIPSLRDKVKTNINEPTDVVYWYIRFNIPLDENSVSGKTMNVTDTEGYIMRTDISFDHKTNMIVISPLDTYEQNRFYLLNISKKVRSARGQKLRSAIHIIFKLIGNQISEFKVLKKNVEVPKPRSRPKDYEEIQAKKRLPYFDREYIEKSPMDQMTTVGFWINPLVGIIGLLIVAVELILSISWILGLIGAAVCLAGVIHIAFQMQKSTIRAKLLFNKGVRLFNNQKYREADLAFKRALTYDPDYDLAEYGVYKTGFYL